MGLVCFTTWMLESWRIYVGKYASPMDGLDTLAKWTGSPVYPGYPKSAPKGVDLILLGFWEMFHPFKPVISILSAGSLMTGICCRQVDSQPPRSGRNRVQRCCGLWWSNEHPGMTIFHNFRTSTHEQRSWKKNRDWFLAVKLCQPLVAKTVVVLTGEVGCCFTTT